MQQLEDRVAAVAKESESQTSDFGEWRVVSTDKVNQLEEHMQDIEQKVNEMENALASVSTTGISSSVI